MHTKIYSDQLSAAKRAFTTRNVPASALHSVVSGAIKPQAGDLVLARVMEVGSHKSLELPTSRKATLFADDEVILVYGNRYAPDQFEAYVPDDLGPCELAAGGGIAGRVVARNERMSDPTTIAPIGLFVDANKKIVNLRDYALPKAVPSRKIPAIAVVGGSMNAGKTTTAASLIRGLSNAGYKVGAAKLTGTGAGNDYWHMFDAGAQRVVDFTDAGLATTFKATHEQLESCVNTLAASLIETGANVMVFEVADGVFQEETAWLLQSSVLARLTDGYLYAGESAASAALGVSFLQKYGRVLGVSGLLTRSPLASREAEIATGLRILRREDLVTAEVAEGFLATFRQEFARKAA